MRGRYESRLEHEAEIDGDTDHPDRRQRGEAPRDRAELLYINQVHWEVRKQRACVTIMSI